MRDESFPRARFFDPYWVRLFVGVSVALLLTGALCGAVLALLTPRCHFPPANHARTVRTTVMQFMAATNLERGCPTIAALIRGGHLAPSTDDTISDSQFRITCSGLEVDVIYAGPDGRLGTADDMRAP